MCCDPVFSCGDGVSCCRPARCAGEQAARNADGSANSRHQQASGLLQVQLWPSFAVFAFTSRALFTMFSSLLWFSLSRGDCVAAGQDVFQTVGQRDVLELPQIVVIGAQVRRPKMAVRFKEDTCPPRHLVIPVWTAFSLPMMGAMTRAEQRQIVRAGEYRGS